MACGNNHVTRDFLTSTPAPVSQLIGAREEFRAPQQMPTGRFEVLVDEGLRAATKGTPQGMAMSDRHVHVVYNTNVAGVRNPTGMVTVTVTDRSNSDEFSRPRSGDPKKGHVEETLFLRPPAPGRVEAEVRRAVDLLRSRARGSR